MIANLQILDTEQHKDYNFRDAQNFCSHILYFKILLTFVY